MIIDYDGDVVIDDDDDDADDDDDVDNDNDPSTKRPRRKQRAVHGPVNMTTKDQLQVDHCMLHYGGRSKRDRCELRYIVDGPSRGQPENINKQCTLPAD